MYRCGDNYDRMAELVGEIYIDYDIHSFPINEKEVCRKMGIRLLPYGEFPPLERELLKKRSPSGFYVPPTGETPPMIYFNNDIKEVGSVGNMRRNIFHEVRHYVCEDNDENTDEDDLADYLGKYFLAPISYLIAMKIYNINQIMADFEVDYDMASFIEKNLRNRRKRYGFYGYQPDCRNKKKKNNYKVLGIQVSFGQVQLVPPEKKRAQRRRKIMIKNLYELLILMVL